MKKYDGKNFEDALATAAKDLGKSTAEIRPLANIVSQKKSLFSTRTTIGLFTADDVFAYACGYLDTVLTAMGAKAVFAKRLDAKTNVLTIVVSSDQGAKIIGKNGETLKALNTVVRSAVFNEFGGKFRILLDCDNYKQVKYEKIRILARNTAEDVRTSHIPASLPPMSSDERRIVHEALAGMRDIDDPSVDDGKKRHIVIKYMPGNVAKADK